MRLNLTWVLILTVISASCIVALRVQKAYALATITIRSDGGIEPLGAPIVTYDNVTYTLTENITSDEGITGIVIEKDYMVLDGAGFTLQGNHSGQDVSGVLLNSVTGATVKNLRVVFYRYGITINGGTNNAVWGNTVVANSQAGIKVGGSHHTVYGNIVNAANETDYVWGQDGIVLVASSYNNITGNTITGHSLYGIYLAWYDLWLQSSTNNILRNNVMINNKYNFNVETGIPADYVNDVDESNTVDGKPMYYWVNQHDRTVPTDAGYVALVQCSGIAVQNAVLSKNQQGILLISTSNSTITNCSISQSSDDIYCGWSNGITISGNYIFVDIFRGICIVESSNCTVSQNTVVFNEEKADSTTLYGFNMASCTNLAASENTILFDYADYRPKLYFYSCSNAAFTLNNIGDVQMYFYSDTSMTFVHNNFLWTEFSFQGTNQLYSWDEGYPSGGNYWDAVYGDTDIYEGPGQNETGSDGIWDHPFSVGGGFVDNYPLVYPTRSIPVEFYAGYGRSVEMATASKVTDFAFNATSTPPYVRFNVTGLDGTSGSCEVSLPIDLLWGTFSVYLDGVLLTEGVDYTKSQNSTYWAFHIGYTHSTHTIQITGTAAIPEFPVALFLFACTTIAATLTFLLKRRRYKNA